MRNDQTGDQTANLTIRIMERRDIEDARRTHNDLSTLLQLTDVDHVSEAQQEQWLQSISLSPKCRRYTIIETATCDFVGIFRVDQIDWKNRSTCVGLDIAADKRGNGYAIETYDYFFSYYFNHCGMNRLYLAVLETNEVARDLYAKLGFVVEGKGREAVFRNGKFVDYIWMSLLKREYDSLVDQGRGKSATRATRR